MSHAPIRSLTNVLLAGSLSFGLTHVARAQDAAPAEASWTDDVKVGVFVDAYGGLNSQRNEAGNVPAHEAFAGKDGFQLAFAGGDLSYSGEQFGATISLRFGPGVVRFYAADLGYLGIDNITQAYATWRPVEGLTLDLGQFGTIFGAEVSESWRNVNYTRGALYYAMQPFWHTGLRANYAINDMLGINAMIVNGVNTTEEGNKSPTLALQALVTPTESLFIAAGYMGTPHPRDGDEGAADLDGDPTTPPTEVFRFDHFFDIVTVLTLGDFKLVGNFDFNLYRDTGVADSENWWGVSVAPAYAITNWMGVAARVEYLATSSLPLWAPPGETDANLLTLTGTLDFKPVPNSGAVVLRPELRVEKANGDIYDDGPGKTTDLYWSAVLGAVVTSM